MVVRRLGKLVLLLEPLCRFITPIIESYLKSNMVYKIIFILFLLFQNLNEIMGQDSFLINRLGIGGIKINKKVSELKVVYPLKMFDQKGDYIFNSNSKQIFFVGKEFQNLFPQFKNVKSIFI